MKAENLLYYQRSCCKIALFYLLRLQIQPIYINRAHKDLLDQEDLPDPVESLDRMVHQENVDKMDSLDNLDQVDRVDPLGNLDLRDHLDPVDKMELLEHLDREENLDNRDLLDLEESLVSLSEPTKFPKNCLKNM